MKDTAGGLSTMRRFFARCGVALYSLALCGHVRDAWNGDVKPSDGTHNPDALGYPRRGPVYYNTPPLTLLLSMAILCSVFYFVPRAYPQQEDTSRSIDQPPQSSDAAPDAEVPETSALEAATASNETTPPLTLSEFRPHPMLRVARTKIERARFPVVDVHTHFGYRMRGDREKLKDFVERMDRNQIAICVSLDGRLPDGLVDQQQFLWKDYQDRFVIFAHLDWQGKGHDDQPATWACNQPEFVRATVIQLEQAAKTGASGLKLFKRFGLTYRNADGSLIRIDDARWDPIWEACGRLELPVLIHTADPAAFFLPIDATNERYEELSRHPDWSFPADRFPSREALLAARNRVIERHPKTKFIGAHMANNPEDLAQVGRWLRRYPNLFVELASRIGELGRQPYTSRAFLVEHSDRVLFGTDGPWPEPRLHAYWRYLETFDEYFAYSEKEIPPQGLWNIYGVNLPEEVLRKIYYENAARLIPGVKQRLAKWQVEGSQTE